MYWPSRPKSLPLPSRRDELAGKQKAAEQQNGFADQNAGECRTSYPDKGDEAACRGGHAHDQRDVGKGAAWKENKLGNDTGEYCRRHCTRPDDNLRILIETAREQKPQCAPEFIRQEPD